MTDPTPPRLPDSSRPRSGSGRRTPEQANTATFAALIGLGLLGFALISLVALVLPQVRGLVLVLCGAVGFFAAHYVVWGWWLPRLMQNDDAEQDA